MTVLCIHMLCSLLGLSQWYYEGSKKYGKAGFNEASKDFSPDDISSMDGKVVAITGMIELWIFSLISLTELNGNRSKCWSWVCNSYFYC